MEITSTTEVVQDAPIFSLPLELFRKIVRHLSTDDYGNFLRTCKAFATTRPLYVEGNEEAVSAIIRYFGGFLEIAEKFQAEIIYKQHCIQVLNLANSAITDDGLATIACLFPNITHLNIQGCFDTSSAGLQHVAQLKKLHILNLTFCYKITDSGLYYVAMCASLQHLLLYGCHEITDNGLKELSTLPELRTLNIRACSKITDAGLGALKKAKNLKSLNVSGCSITLDGPNSLREALPDLCVWVG